MNKTMIKAAIAVVAAATLVLGGSGVANATAPEPATPVSTSAPSSYQAVELAVPVGTTLPGSELSELAEHGMRVVLVNPSTGQRIVVAGPSTPQGPTTQISVGLGWHIYIYLSRSDFRFLKGFSEAVVVAVVCAAIGAETAGIACGVIAYVVFDVVNDYAPPQQDQCKEIAINYWGTLSSVKNVSSSHC